MSFLAHIFHPRLTERKEGACLIWVCPKCQKAAVFQLVVGEAHFAALGLQISESCRYFDLQCSNCKYELRVDSTDKPALDRASELTMSLLEGQIDLEAYEKKVRGLPARFVKNLLALTQIWKCTNCGEENPITFDSCWNCQTQRIPKPRSS
jgi:hypothetical protein